MFERIFVAVDGSAASTGGLKTAIGLAADQHASLHILHVIDAASVPPALEVAYLPAQFFDEMTEALRESGRAILAKAKAMAAARGVEADTTLAESVGGTVARAILTQARKKRADLIVLGTHGRRGLSRALMGSDAEMVLREARVPVLLVRAAPSAARRPAVSTGKPAGAAKRAGRAASKAAHAPG